MKSNSSAVTPISYNLSFISPKPNHASIKNLELFISMYVEFPFELLDNTTTFILHLEIK